MTQAEMDPGSCIIFRGNMYHRTGGNSTPEARAALLFTYSLAWLPRQEENQYLANPIEAVRR